LRKNALTSKVPAKNRCVPIGLAESEKGNRTGGGKSQNRPWARVAAKGCGSQAGVRSTKPFKALRASGRKRAAFGDKRKQHIGFLGRDRRGGAKHKRKGQSSEEEKDRSRILVTKMKKKKQKGVLGPTNTAKKKD